MGYTLEADKKTMAEDLVKDADNCSLMTMSNISEEGMSEVKASACDKLLASRVESRIGGKKIESVMNRLQVFYPTARDANERDVRIPDTVKAAKEDGDATKKNRGLNTLSRRSTTVRLPKRVTTTNSCNRTPMVTMTRRKWRVNLCGRTADPESGPLFSILCLL